MELSLAHGFVKTGLVCVQAWIARIVSGTVGLCFHIEAIPEMVAFLVLLYELPTLLQTPPLCHSNINSFQIGPVDAILT